MDLFLTWLCGEVRTCRTVTLGVGEAGPLILSTTGKAA